MKPTAVSSTGSIAGDFILQWLEHITVIGLIVSTVWVFTTASIRKNKSNKDLADLQTANGNVEALRTANQLLTAAKEELKQENKELREELDKRPRTEIIATAMDKVGEKISSALENRTDNETKWMEANHAVQMQVLEGLSAQSNETKQSALAIYDLRKFMQEQSRVQTTRDNTMISLLRKLVGEMEEGGEKGGTVTRRRPEKKPDISTK